MNAPMAQPNPAWNPTEVAALAKSLDMAPQEMQQEIDNAWNVYTGAAPPVAPGTAPDERLRTMANWVVGYEQLNQGATLPPMRETLNNAAASINAHNIWA